MKNMKNIILISAILISGFGSTLFAQSFPDPEFSSRPYFIENDSTLKTLEKTEAKYEIKIKSMGYGGSEVYYTAFKSRSEIRFSKVSLPKLVIKIESDIDPSDIVTLAKAIVLNDRRRFVQSSMALGGKTRDLSKYYVMLEFKKIQEEIYEIILPKNMEAGEYAFMPIIFDAGNILKQKIYCFGVD